jgi:hypothetical protein
LSDAELHQLEVRIRHLGSESFAEREQASRQLVAVGAPALVYLQHALQHADLEIVRRADACIAEIQRAQDASLPAAAVRVLARRQAADALGTLLGYIAFADDDSVEDEVLSALVALRAGAAKLDPALVAALHDPLPARRAAAAYVLGRGQDAGQAALVEPLLADPDVKVRLRAAQGLASARRKSAVPVLISLLAEPSPAVAWQAEELLQRLAGEQTPLVPGDDGTLAVRLQRREAWAVWWRDRGPSVDWSRMNEERQLGLTLVAELDSNRVWEFGPDGNRRWELRNLHGPIDAHLLPGGRVLVAEHNVPRVVEYDLQGHEHWRHRIPNGNPIACQRLPNGNTFIATYNQVLEVTRDGREVYTHTLRGGQGPIFGAQKLRSGPIVCISAQGKLLKIDPASGAVLSAVLVRTHGGWCGVEALDGGRFLIAATSQNKVLEVDAAGQTLWQCTVRGACHAIRLANGNTLVASMTTSRVVEVDRAGTEVMAKRTEGRPFHVHRR